MSGIKDIVRQYPYRIERENVVCVLSSDGWEQIRDGFSFMDLRIHVETGDFQTTVNFETCNRKHRMQVHNAIIALVEAGAHARGIYNVLVMLGFGRDSILALKSEVQPYMRALVDTGWVAWSDGVYSVTQKTRDAFSV
jgi:hypothetical protein